jgi:hypothetical protein
MIAHGDQTEFCRSCKKPLVLSSCKTRNPVKGYCITCYKKLWRRQKTEGRETRRKPERTESDNEFDSSLKKNGEVGYTIAFTDELNKIPEHVQRKVFDLYRLGFEPVEIARATRGSMMNSRTINRLLNRGGLVASANVGLHRCKTCGGKTEFAPCPLCETRKILGVQK